MQVLKWIAGQGKWYALALLLVALGALAYFDVPLQDAWSAFMALLNTP